MTAKGTCNDHSRPTEERRAGVHARPHRRPRRIGLVVLALGYVHVSSGDDAVSVPSGAKAGDLILHDCDYATEDGSYAADCGTLVVPENRHKAGSRLIALPVTRIRARSARSRGADLPPPGRSGHHEHGLPDGEPVRRQARRRAGRLPRRRRLVEARLSRGDLGPRASARLLTEKAMRADAAAYQDCAERLQDDGFDLAGYTLPATRRRPRRRPQGAGLRARRPPQRERGDTHGAGLRLAVSAADPPLGHDRRQPARPLPLGREDDGRADPAVRRALCRRRVVPGPDARSRGVDRLGVQPTCLTTGGSCRSGRATSGWVRSSASCTRPPTVRGRSTGRGRSTRSSTPTTATAAARGSCR